MIITKILIIRHQNAYPCSPIYAFRNDMIWYDRNEILYKS